MRSWIPALIGLGCTPRVLPPEALAPTCDGLLQEGEDTLDSPFDADGDGFVDANNADCRDHYSSASLDCDDADNGLYPGNLEVDCNGLDDDCNADTPDARDEDQDGTPACDDCDDEDPFRFPGNEETCWDGLDNDCDDQIDPGCGYDYAGTFQLAAVIQYSCAVNSVNIDFDELVLIYNPPSAAVYPLSGAQPGTLDGSIEADGTFLFEGSAVIGTAASCSEFYRITGQFSDGDHFTGEFEAQFVGGFACLNCENQLFTGLVGTRVSGP